MKELLTGCSSIEVTVESLLSMIYSEYGKDVDLSKIKLHIDYEKYACFGYDLHDSNDYHIVICAEKEN